MRHWGGSMGKEADAGLRRLFIKIYPEKRHLTPESLASLAL
jgi:hypothetical protein